ncbi:MAG: hypothetical protein M1469_08340 [Bacteroidetes bacterium]|nr:hypothetical protein [Bacteroidota bacterium]
MGKVAMLSVLTLLFVLGIVGYSLNRRTSDAVKNYAGYYEDDVARNIATSAVEIYILKLKDDQTLLGNFTIPAIMNGEATVNISQKIPGNSDTLLMTSVGIYNGATDTVRNELYAVQGQIPPILGAVGMSSGKSATIKISGNALTSGQDVNLNGTPVSPAHTVAGIAINLTNPSNNVSISATASVTGNGAVSPDTERVASLPDYTSFADEMIRLAKVYTGQTFSTSSPSLGTDNSPQISYITGNSTMSGTFSGSGILIVNGNLTMSGQFTFHGLIIAYGNTNISIQTTGQSKVYGAMIIAGDNTSYSQSGNSTIQYSSQALDDAASQVIGRYLIADWWE